MARPRKEAPPEDEGVAVRNSPDAGLCLSRGAEEDEAFDTSEQGDVEELLMTPSWRGATGDRFWRRRNLAFFATAVFLAAAALALFVLIPGTSRSALQALRGPDSPNSALTAVEAKADGGPRKHGLQRWLPMRKAHPPEELTSDSEDDSGERAEEENVSKVVVRPDGLASLFCFSVMTLGGQEEELVRKQLSKRASIFACDEFAVISTKRAKIGEVSWGDVWTWKNPAPKVKTGIYGKNGQTTDSFLNTAIFIEAWNTLIKSKRIWKYDWTVKVDPDAVFFPDRLRKRVGPYTGLSAYFANCHKWGEWLLYGAVEVYSKEALGAYQDNAKTCYSYDWQGWGEDFFMRVCMDSIGVMQVGDSKMVGDDRCIGAPCTDWTRIAYHPFKDPEDYFDCFEQAIR